jgi:hypothetical protein
MEATMNRKRDAMYVSMGLVLVLTAGLVAACAMEGEGDELGVESVPGEAEDVVVAGESADAVEGEGESDLASCSYVEWCNAPGSDGTVCQQTGCTRSEAIAECRREVSSICGRPTCPWIFRTPGGGRIDLCNCSPNCNLTESPADDAD